MGLLDKLTDRVTNAVLGDPSTAATNDVHQAGPLDGPAADLVGKLVDFGIEGRGRLDSAAKVAQEAANGRSTEQAIDKIVAQHTKIAAAGGFLTGLGGFATMAVALPVNVIEFYVVGTRMVAAIAKLRGYDIDKQEVRSAVLLSLVGADSADLLTKAGVTGVTGRLSQLATRRLPAPALMLVNKGVGFRIVKDLGEKGLSRFLGKSIPVAGGVIGGGVDYFMLRKLADFAKEQFPAQPSA